MLMTLFLKECRQMAKCLTYYVVVICIIFMYTTQIGSEGVIRKPQPGQKDYGFTISEDKTVIMNQTLITLSREYYSNNYSTYPFAFLKKVTLNDAKQAQIGGILAKAAGMEKKELDERLKAYFAVTYLNTNTNNVTDESQKIKSETTDQKGITDKKKPSVILPAVSEEITYHYFTKLMTKADKLLGGGSSYAKDKLQGNAYVPMTYEQAMAEYNDIIKNDHLSGAYARLFCDYIGIVLAILPVFLIVTRCLRDRRAKANEIIYSRRASSVQIMISRYLATVIMLLIPIILLACFQTVECIYVGKKEGIAIDYLAYFKYIGGWILPTILIVTSIGAFFTELTDSAIAIIIQGLWWIVSVMSGKLMGNSGWNLIPRFNTLGKYQIFRENFNQLVINRISYTIAAIVVLLMTIYIYELKRKGMVNIRGKIFSNRKIKSEA